ncbi:MAG TPA: hypothetical protein VH600_05010 [Burkholderiales bacterium]|jgi:hypothetical protein
MTPAKLIVALLLALAAFAATAQETFQGTLGRPAAANPSQYSFADIYRLALVGPAAAGLAPVAAAETTVRVASTQPPAQFAVAEGREPRLWMLLLAGIAAAVWVARRRLGYAF